MDIFIKQVFRKLRQCSQSMKVCVGCYGVINKTCICTKKKLQQVQNENCRMQAEELEARTRAACSPKPSEDDKARQAGELRRLIEDKKNLNSHLKTLSDMAANFVANNDLDQATLQRAHSKITVLQHKIQNVEDRLQAAADTYGFTADELRKLRAECDMQTQATTCAEDGVEQVMISLMMSSLNTQAGNDDQLDPEAGARMQED